MKQYGLGPNGGILTASNLFATRFDQVGTGVQTIILVGCRCLLVCCLAQIPPALTAPTAHQATAHPAINTANHSQQHNNTPVTQSLTRPTPNKQTLPPHPIAHSPPHSLTHPPPQVIQLLEKPRDPALKYVFVDTPGQIEIFTWSASGQLITGTV